MSDDIRTAETVQPRVPWNKGKLTGPKAPLKVREIWAIRIRLQLASRPRDLARGRHEISRTASPGAWWR
jgi:hypothetical protein